ncbi:MAG TPA: carboxypeptidase regulatory-like domain-containing protein [Bryobacteraceae bacterium]|nr:carboxypeptidase regulatory-like domain-containing protein [Bryobacteraceae bacterium]
MRLVRIAGAVLLGACAVVFGQSTGTINGRVTDPSGAAVAGAQISVTNTGTAVVRNTVTNAQGLYSVPALQPGDYDVKVENPGFALSERKGVTLLAESALTLDFSLSLAAANQQITVESEVASLVETTQSSVNASLQVNEVENLPVLNRQFTGLVTLIPGARPAPITNGTKGAMMNGISIGGSRGQNMNTLVDGADNKDDITGGPLQNYTLEGIEEFRLITHQYGAQYGRSNGGELVIVTKSGNNALHGSGFAYGRNDAMTAIDYFTRVQNLPKTPYDREQYGGSLGGPVIKDRWFWFGAAERVQQDNTVTPTPQALKQVQYLIPFGAVPANQLSEPYRDLLYTAKTDFRFNTKHSLTVRWGEQWNSYDDDLLGTNQPDLSAQNHDNQGYWSLVGSETWLVSPNALNQFTVQRNHSVVDQALNGNSANNPTGVYTPVTSILIFPSVRIGRPANADHYFFESKLQFRDDFSIQKGAHSWKIGGDLSTFPRIGILTNLGGGCGSVAFFDDPSTIVNNTNGKYPQGWLTPGIVSSIFQGTCSAGGPPADTSLDGPKQFGTYVQDDWRVGRRLTFNFGLRYDVDINFLNQPHLADSRVYQALKAINNQYAHLPGTPTHAFGPRFGFAWDINGDSKSVLRGGYGLFWDESLQGNIWTAVQLMVPDIYVTASQVNSGVGVGQLANYIFRVSPLPTGTGAVTTQLPKGASTVGSWIAPDFSLPYNHQFHLGYTRQLTGNSAISMDATHVQNLNEYRTQNMNPIEGAWDPNFHPAAACGAKGQPPCPRRLAPLFQSVLGDPSILGAIALQTSRNRSRYDEVIFDYQRRAGKITLNASYTLAWAYGYGGSIGACTICAVQTPQPVNQDSFFGPGEWGPASTDQRHRIVTSGIINLWWGIQAAPIFQIGSPMPYNLIAGSDLNGDGTSNDHYVDPKTQLPVSINSARGIWDYDLDLRVTKFINLWSERRKLGLFAEGYNLTNKANFGNLFGGNGRSSTFEQPVGYLAGLPTSRQLQLGARITF